MSNQMAVLECNLRHAAEPERRVPSPLQVALADFDRQPCNRYALAGESTHIPDWPRNRDITERRAALLGISQEVIERTGHSALMTLVALAERKLRA